jgi:hypothetical protein
MRRLLRQLPCNMLHYPRTYGTPRPRHNPRLRLRPLQHLLPTAREKATVPTFLRSSSSRSRNSPPLSIRLGHQLLAILWGPQR